MGLEQPISRRQALIAGAAGVGTCVLAACSSGSNNANASGEETSSGSSSSSSSQSSGTPSSARLAKLAAVPVGGSASAQLPDGEPVIVSQPTAGTAVAFSALCTHMQCTVAPAGKLLKCPCHGSVYEAFTGKVVQGPAVRPLKKIDVHVESGEVVTGT